MVALAFDMPADFGQRVRAILRDRDMTQEHLADQVGISKSYISKKIRGESRWKSKEVKAIAEFLEIPEEEIAPVPATTRMRGRIPLVSLAQAGRFVAHGGAASQLETEEFVDPCERASKDAIAVRVVGDSMEPNLKHGDVVIVEPVREGGEEMLTEGCIVVVWLNEPDGFAAGGQIGRWQHLGGKRGRLLKDNSKYQGIDLVLTHERTSAIGRAIERRTPL